MKTKTYTNNDITVIWNPSLCTHSGNCVKNLPAVFQPKARPWISMDQADSDAIIAAVAQCPSGALSISSKEQTMSTPTQKVAQTQINCLTNGPLLINGNFTITDTNGKKLAKKDKVALCRCGASQNKPFCDGAHKGTGFEG